MNNFVTSVEVKKGVDGLTFQPNLLVTVNLNFSLEAIQDQIAISGEESVLNLLGAEILAAIESKISS